MKTFSFVGCLTIYDLVVRAIISHALPCAAMEMPGAVIHRRQADEALSRLRRCNAWERGLALERHGKSERMEAS